MYYINARFTFENIGYLFNESFTSIPNILYTSTTAPKSPILIKIKME